MHIRTTLAALFVGLGAIVPVRVPLEERVDAAVLFLWGLAGAFGLASVGYALLAETLLPVKKWLVAGMACALVAFGVFVGDWIVEDLPRSREITLLSFWPLAFTGPVFVSLCYFVCLPRFLRNEASA